MVIMSDDDHVDGNSDDDHDDGNSDDYRDDDHHDYDILLLYTVTKLSLYHNFISNR